MIRPLALAALAIGCGSSEPAPAKSPQVATRPAPAVAKRPPADAAPPEEAPAPGDLDSGSAPRSPPEGVPAWPRVVRVAPVEPGKARITIDRGKRHGVDVGFVGELVTREGEAAPDGFEVYRVTRDSCDGIVEMSPEDVRQYPFARLSPP